MATPLDPKILSRFPSLGKTPAERAPIVEDLVIVVGTEEALAKMTRAQLQQVVSISDEGADGVIAWAAARHDVSQAPVTPAPAPTSSPIPQTFKVDLGRLEDKGLGEWLAMLKKGDKNPKLRPLVLEATGYQKVFVIGPDGNLDIPLTESCNDYVQNGGVIDVTFEGHLVTDLDTALKREKPADPITGELLHNNRNQRTNVIWNISDDRKKLASYASIKNLIKETDYYILVGELRQDVLPERWISIQAQYDLDPNAEIVAKTGLIFHGDMNRSQGRGGSAVRDGRRSYSPPQFPRSSTSSSQQRPAGYTPLEWEQHLMRSDNSSDV